jgi:hypothetical protein
MKKLILIASILLFTACSTQPTIVEDAALSVAVGKLINGDSDKAKRVVERIDAINAALGDGVNVLPADTILKIISRYIDWKTLSIDETVLITAMLEVVRTRFADSKAIDVATIRSILNTIKRTAQRFITR